MSIEQRDQVQDGKLITKPIAADNSVSNVDAFKVYLNRVGEYKLLEPSEEIALAQALNRGRFAESILATLRENVSQTFRFGPFSDKYRELEHIDRLEPGIKQRKVKHDGPIARGQAMEVLEKLKLAGHVELFSESDLSKASSPSAQEDKTINELTEGRKSTEKLAGFRWATSFEELPAKEKLEMQLEDLVGAGEDAREVFIASNLRLAINHAKKYKESSGLVRDDYIEQANVGIIEAVERFDWTKGYKFSTYATWWVRKEILNAKGNASIIRKPRDVGQAYIKIVSARDRMRSKSGKEPSSIQIAEEVGVTPDRVEELLALYLNQDPISLNSTVPGYGFEMLGDFEDDTTRNAVAALESQIEVDIFFEEIGLNHDQSTVLKMAFGFFDGHVWTDEELGEILGKTEADINQLRRGALQMLKRDKRTQTMLRY